MDEKDLEFLKKLATLKENGAIDEGELIIRKSEYFKRKEEELKHKQVKVENERKLLEERRKQSEEKIRLVREREKIEEEKRKQFISRHRKIIISGIGLGIVLLFFLIHTLVISCRTTYSSEDEMQDALQGTWTYSNPSGEVEQQIIIDEDEAAITYDEYEEPFFEHITWNPSKGTFVTNDNKFIVTNNGTIKEDGDAYIQEEDWLDDYNYDYYYDPE